jgi:hypothetical protein
LPGAYLTSRVARDFLRDASLLCDKIIDSMLEPRGIALRGVECQLGPLLLTELIGACGKDAVIRADCAELLVKSREFVLLGVVADSTQVLGDFALRGIDKIAQWLQAACIADERCLGQEPRQEVRFRFRFEESAQVFKPCIERGGSFLSRAHHQVEIGIVNRGGEADKQGLVGGSYRGREVGSLIRHDDPV